MLSFFLILSSLLFCFFFYRLTRPFLQDHFTVIPSARSSHFLPVPTAGGLVIVCSSLFLSTLYLFLCKTPIPKFDPFLFTLLSLFPLFLLCLIDDFLSVSPFLRLLVQILTFIFLIYFLKPHLPLYSIPLIVLTFTAITNFFNFMDGIDGILASCSIIIFIHYGLLTSFTPPLLIFIASLLWFLIVNWQPASLFMGDSGSIVLGGIFCSFLLRSNIYDQSLSLLLVAMPLIIDPLICLVRNLVEKRSILEPHRRHLYQRLVRSGWSHQSTSSLYCLSTFVISFSYFLGGVRIELFVAICILTIGFCLDLLVTDPSLE